MRCEAYWIRRRRELTRLEDGARGVARVQRLCITKAQSGGGLRAAAPPPPTRSRCPHHVRLQAVAPALAPVAKEVSNTPKRGRNTRHACQTSSSWLCSCKMTLRRKCSSGVCFSPTSLATALRSGTALRERSTRHKTRAVSRRRCTTMLARSNHAPACKLAVRALQLARDGVPADVRAPQVGRHAHLQQRE